MKSRLILALLLIFVLGGLVPLQSQENFSLKKDVYVAKDEEQNNVVAFGGNVLVEGKVKQNVIAFGGTITIKGEVGDSVVGIGSAITLAPSAVVNGDLVSLGGTLDKQLGCVIKGDTVYFKANEFFSKFFKGGLKGFFSLSLVPFLLVLKLIAIFIWLLLAIIVTAVFPKQISFASSQIRKSFWPIVGIGVLALIVFSGLVILAALFSILLIGIPILLLLIAIGIIIKIFGTVVIFHFFGESLGRAFGNQRTAPLLAVILGLILVNFIKLIPILGLLFSFCLSIIGWGVTIRTKFGSTENWFRRKA